MMEKAQEPKFRWGYAIFVLLLLSVLGFIAVGIISVFVGVDVESLSGNVALIPIEGVIVATDPNGLFETVTTSTDAIELIEKADKNSNIKAIILQINSPGGSAVASEEIAEAVKKTNKTTVAWIREVGASGAYWIASSTDHIVASRISITGSIGVISSYLEFSGFLEKYGIGYERLVTGDSKDVGTPFRKLTTKETEKIQERLDRLHNIFINEVAENRQLSIDKVKKLADGDVLLGEEALEAGLVDQLGDKVVLESYLKSEYDIEDITYSTYQKETSFFELISGMTSQWSFKMGEGIGAIFLEKSKEPFLI